MQWLDYVFKFMAKIFKTNSFKKKYRTKPAKNFLKILKSEKWQVADLRNVVAYADNHIENTINLPILTFNYKYYKVLDRSKKILLINHDYRSNLNLYRTLKKKHFKVYLLYSNYNDLILEPEVDRHTIITIYE
ncbi:hypothetical protein SHELI_v1c00860 [Spiroplasma helicoides]|uniref:Rhodanese domain-containing protein n=1 Tax=Spiroplasma helicoides TaxID=216938 RepID=A0A1B3SJE0_9MOLU|nr:rhodanese-like domain-containing protein [Spiroplasma helicoides]AOG60041.1 hypothetical protein SHELI_v1c00860 [Spiroplasma helicoides]